MDELKGIDLATSLPITHRVAFGFAWSGWRGSQFLWKFVKFIQKVKESEVVQLPNGFPLRVNSRDWISKTIYEGTYERALLHFLDSLLITDVLVDVGANIGVTLWHGLHANARNATFMAFEPSPQCFDALTLTTSHVIQKGEISKFAIGELDEMRTIYGIDNQAHSGAASLTSHSGLRGGQGIVQVRKLDSVIREKLGDQTVSLLKIDTEGYEAQVVNGGQELLQSGKVEMIVMEVSPNFGSVDYLHVVDRLLDGRYKWFILREKGIFMRKPFLQEITLNRALTYVQQWNLVSIRHDVLARYTQSHHRVLRKF